MLLPLRDDNPTTRTPYVTYAIIILCGLVYLLQLGMSPMAEQRLIYALGAIPAVLLGDATMAPDLALVPSLVTPVTAMFLHGGFFHLAGNMLYLWIFGNNVEDAMGSWRFLVFYLVCGIAAAMTHALITEDTTAPMIGASGAISGVLGAYLLLFPWARVFVWFGFVFLFWVPAIFVLGLWFGLQALSLLGDPTGVSSVAFGAHVGGFVVGLVLTPLFRRVGVPLFSRQRVAHRLSMIPRSGRINTGSRRQQPPPGPWDHR